MSENSADIGLVGLAVMGQNLILNMADNGFTVAAFNRTVEKVDKFIQNEAKGKSIIGCKSIEEFIASLKKPRRIMMMVKSGAPVDALIEQLLPLLEKGDIIIDGGNSHYPDSQARYLRLQEKGILYVGTGISGGEEGARNGPSIMPGGDEAAWPSVKDIFQKISAKVEGDSPCCDWVGTGGAGHYVKMVHNGIEYGDIQLICEAYDLLHRGAGFSYDELHDLFTEWNKGILNSYLIEIAAQIFAKKEEDGSFLLDKILDTAGQKGTGKWTAIHALDSATPVTLIGEAVFARGLSAAKEDRMEASKKIKANATVAFSTLR